MQAPFSDGRAQLCSGNANKSFGSYYAVFSSPDADQIISQTRVAVLGPLNAASKQIRSYAADAKASPTEVSSILEQRIRGVQEEAGLAETGRVLSVGYVDKDEQSKAYRFGLLVDGTDTDCAVLTVTVLPVYMA